MESTHTTQDRATYNCSRPTTFLASHSSNSAISSLSSLSSPSWATFSLALRCRILAFAPHCSSLRAFLSRFRSSTTPSVDTFASSFSSCFSCNFAAYRTRSGRRRIYPQTMMRRRSQSELADDDNGHTLCSIRLNVFCEGLILSHPHHREDS